MTPQWGSNSKGWNGIMEFEEFKFQSPQWGSNSKEVDERNYSVESFMFQSPQWGSNSKVTMV